MAARLSIFHKGLILILSPIFLETIVVLALYSVLTQTDRQQAIESSYKDRSASVIKMSSLSFEACMLLFAMGMPGGSRLPEGLFDEKLIEVRQQANKAERLMGSDPYLRPVFTPLHQVQFHAIDMLQDLAETVSKGSGTALISQLDETINTVVGMLNDTSGLVDKFINYNDRRITESRRLMEELRSHHFTILLSALAGNLVLAGSLMWYFNQSIIRRLGRIRNNTELLRSGQELPAALRGNDEIALLDQSFHAMQQALKDSKRKEELFFENAADVICILNRQNEFTRLNQASKFNWGISPAALVGKSIESIVSAEDRDSTLAQLNRCRESGNSASFENRVMRDQDRAVEYLWSVYVEPVEKQLYCVAHDISAQKEVERARERYIAIVSNDLKQPIASISNSFDAVKEIAGLPEKAINKIGAVSNNLQRLLCLVDELSTRHSFGSSDGELSIGTINLADLIEQAVADVEGLARLRKIKIVSQPLQLEIQADRNRLMQVLVNLLSNAIKFSPGLSEVIISASDAGEYVELTVKDHGRGIPEAQLETVFEKFKQVAESDGRRAAGTGLGLPICKQIVEQHSGSIGVNSKPDEGSTFWIRLPKFFHLDETIMATAGTGSNPENTRSLSTPEIKEEKQGSGQTTNSWQDLPLLLKGAMLVGIPLLFEVVLVGALTFLFLQSEAVAKTEILERQIANCANGITFCYRKMAIAVLGPRQDGQYESFRKNRDETTEIARQLRTLVKNDPRRTQQLEKIFKQIKACNKTLERSYALKNNTAQQPVQYLSIGITLRLLKPLGNLTRQLQDFVQESSRKESLSPQRQKQLRQLQINLLAGGLGVNIILGLALARLFSNDIRRRLELVAKNTSSLAREEELSAPLTGADEIAVLDRAFHQAAAELSEARKRERTLFDNSREVICSFDEGGRMSGVNPAASKLWGYAKNELLSTDFLSIVYADDRELTQEKLFSGVPLQSPLSFENRVVKKDGTNSDLLWSATRAAGQKEIFCVAHDISGRKEADRLRNEFLSIVSHDLRTPLAGILITTTMLEEGGFGTVPAQAVGKLASVTSDVNRLLELINDLLDIEKLEAGMMAFTIAQVELKELAQEFAERSKKLLEDKQITLHIDAKEAVLTVDKERFLQALSNLLVSAIERAPAGSSIDIFTTQDSESFSLIIRDHSTPLDSQSRTNIFDRFAIRTSSTDAGKVSSLSVPLSKSIIKSHGGTVVLSDDKESGNEFVVRLPISSAMAIAGI